MYEEAVFSVHRVMKEGKPSRQSRLTLERRTQQPFAWCPMFVSMPTAKKALSTNGQTG